VVWSGVESVQGRGLLIAERGCAGGDFGQWKDGRAVEVSNGGARLTLWAVGG
jgi:hypothetical protein